jgi:acetyl esterase
MELDPQCRALLDSFVAAWPAIDYASITASELRNLLAGPSPFAAGDEVRSIVDRNIQGPVGPLRLRIYHPLTQHDVLPITLYFHGGGFACGQVEGHDNVCRTIAQRAQSVVVSVDYRLAPEAKFPAANHDAMTALNWVREHGSELGGDPGRIAVAGDSAGANLATVLAHRARESEPSLRHQLLFYPVTDCRFDTASYRDFSAGYLLTVEMMQWYWRQYLPDQQWAANPEASPLRQPDLRGVAPATVITAGFDPLRDEGRAYATALRNAHVPVEHREWPGQIHGFVSMIGAIDAALEAIDYGAKALGQALALPHR